MRMLSKKEWLTGPGLRAAWLLLALCLSIPGFGQFGEDLPDQTDSLAFTPQDTLPPVDTLILNWYRYADPFAQNPFTDSILHRHFTQYNPLYETDLPWLSLGNLGSAAIPMTQQIERQGGFDPGYHAFDVYAKRTDSLRWYHTNIPFTDLYFSNGKTESDFRVMAKFTKDFANGLNLNIDYSRIMDEGYYQNQATKQSSLITGLRKDWNGGRHQSYLTYLNNIHQEENNGGIQSLDLLDNPNYDIRLGMPVKLAGSVSRLQEDQVEIRHFAYFGRKPGDSSDSALLPYYLDGRAAYTWGFFKFYDEDTDNTTDSLFYGPLLTDEIGLRHYIAYDRFSLSPGAGADLGMAGKVHAGFDYDWWIYRQEPISRSHHHTLKFQAEWAATWGRRVDLQAKGETWLANQAGDYRLEAGLQMRFNDYLLLTARQRLQRCHPAAVEQQLYVSGQLVQENGFIPALTSESRAGIRVPRLGLSAELRYSRMENSIYFHPEALFVQDPGGYDLLELRVQHHARLKGFHWENRLFLYRENAAFLDLPGYYGQSDLYFSGFIFHRRLYLDAGLEVYLTEGFYIPGYQPLTGRFYAQSELKSELYPLVNARLSVKVGSVRFFIRSENLLDLAGLGHYVQASIYPQNDFRTFRLGVRWQFLN